MTARKVLPKTDIQGSCLCIMINTNLRSGYYGIKRQISVKKGHQAYWQNYFWL